ncbi:MAG: AmmeMemoRadiSam system protein B [Spirochaetales bacterium]|nr:AmmeMemoRadiSam system protein B [Spirochaetales bacterium]
MDRERAHRKIRDAVVAGIFYPDEPAELARAVDAALDASPNVETGALAILSPRAGFGYSGAVQAAAWKAAAGRPVSRVVVLGTRRYNGQDSVYLPESSVFKTPLGFIHVDRDLCAELESCGTMFDTNDLPHLEDHSIEVQLPFMQRLFPDADLVPLILEGADGAVVANLARALDLVIAPLAADTLIVVSSNLGSSRNSDDALATSEHMLELISSKQWRGLLAQRDHGFSHGSAALAAFLAMKNASALDVSVLARADSKTLGHESADRVVHYAAAAWRRKN